MPIQDIVWKTFRERWAIETGGERGSGRSVLAAWHDDNVFFRESECSNWFSNGKSSRKKSNFYSWTREVDIVYVALTITLGNSRLKTLCNHLATPALIETCNRFLPFSNCLAPSKSRHKPISLSCLGGRMIHVTLKHTVAAEANSRSLCRTVEVVTILLDLSNIHSFSFPVRLYICLPVCLSVCLSLSLTLSLSLNWYIKQIEAFVMLMDIIVGNRHGYTSSNPRRNYLYLI